MLLLNHVLLIVYRLLHMWGLYTCFYCKENCQARGDHIGSDGLRMEQPRDQCDSRKLDKLVRALKTVVQLSCGHEIGSIMHKVCKISSILLQKGMPTLNLD